MLVATRRVVLALRLTIDNRCYCFLEDRVWCSGVVVVGDIQSKSRTECRQEAMIEECVLWVRQGVCVKIDGLQRDVDVMYVCFTMV